MANKKFINQNINIIKLGVFKIGFANIYRY